MDRVRFTKEEVQWFARNIKKMTELLETASRKDKGILERSTYKSLLAMVPKADQALTENQEETDIMLTRKQRLVLRELISSVGKTLTERVIPEYQRRGESHKEYLTNAQNKAEKLSKMVRKLR